MAFICMCVAANEEIISQKASEYLNGIHIVTPQVVVDFHHYIDDDKSLKRKRCGQCLLAVSDILTAKAEEMGIQVRLESKNRENLIAVFKNV